jgi:hypothetical protein
VRRRGGSSGDGRGVLGPPLTPAHYDEFADDLLGCGYEPRDADAAWRALDAVGAPELAALRRRVEERNSGARQAVDVAALLASLQPSAAAELIGAVGAMAATTADELRDARRTSDDLWAARSWYEAELQQLRER